MWHKATELITTRAQTYQTIENIDVYVMVCKIQKTAAQVSLVLFLLDTPTVKKIHQFITLKRKTTVLRNVILSLMFKFLQWCFERIGGNQKPRKKKHAVTLNIFRRFEWKRFLVLVFWYICSSFTSAIW